MIVLDTVRPVAERARHVRINDAAIAGWVDCVGRDDLRPTHHELPAYLPGNKAQLANFVLLIDALNFCFWSGDPIRTEWRGKTYHRFEAFLVNAMIAVRHDPRWFNAEHWVDARPSDLDQLLRLKGELLLHEERVDIIRETGWTLIERFDGQFIHAVESVNERAWPLAVLLMTNFDSFRDVSRYQGQPVYLLKRAQICALDLSVAWNTHDHDALDGLEELTAFADYRVPQSLRHMGILEYAPELAKAIDSGVELAHESEEEVEIRAMTILAVECMRAALAETDMVTPAWQIDWYLWGLSHSQGIQGCHHKTRTVFY